MEVNPGSLQTLALKNEYENNLIQFAITTFNLD